MSLLDTLRIERRLKRMEAMMRTVRVKWYDYEDVGKLPRVQRFELFVLRRRIALLKAAGTEYKPGLLIDAKKRLNELKKRYAL